MEKIVDDKKYRKESKEPGIFDTEKIRESTIKLHETIKRDTMEEYTTNTRQKDDNWAKDIRAAYKERKIDYLVHFTKAYNIKDIMKYGLLTMSSRIINEVRPKRNDDKRLEGSNVTSLSITFPNYKNFYSFRIKDNDAWVVLLINPKILETKICRFYYANAAKGNFRKGDRYELMDIEDFENLFAEWGDGKWTRKQLLRALCACCCLRRFLLNQTTESFCLLQKYSSLTMFFLKQAED